ncbi:uncharacterized protein [Rutidosis leptorrhynchoides]|uniref:uncharacterized protein n=1 Tax=Rutidosis leptorrhynchoides TaxID=125765 RepID=UPI003A9933DA
MDILNSTFSYNSVWSNIVKTGHHIDSLGVGFRSSFIKNIGDGASTSFWNDVWLGDVKVRDRVAWDGEKWAGGWNWTREVVGRTHDELQDLNRMLQQASLRPDTPDFWAWAPGSNARFRTKCLTELIDAISLQGNNASLSTLRNSFTPKKVELFVWRTRKGRLPILPELYKRGIDLNSIH